jgi:GDP-L-fucose synthase
LLTVARRQVDLKCQKEVEEWMAETRPEAVFVAAATVGGILANSTRPAEFIYDNLAIETNVIHAAWKTGVEKLLFLGSACIYPKNLTQPMKEEALLTGPLEPTNQWYAVAKIAGIKMCEAYRKQYSCDFISAQPTNLYGPGDNFELQSSHVIPALIAKVHQAKQDGAPEYVVWGSGKPRREFLFIDDLADALVTLMKAYSGDLHINVGSGDEINIAELASAVAEVVGYPGKVFFDSEKPDGVMRRFVDISRIRKIGWEPKTSLRDGLAQAYDWYLDNKA